MTLPETCAGGFSAHAELCAGCPPELLRQGRRYFTCRSRQRWQEIDLWCADQLSSADRAYLRAFQPSLEYPLLDRDAPCSLVGWPLEGGRDFIQKSPRSASGANHGNNPGRNMPLNRTDDTTLVPTPLLDEGRVRRLQSDGLLS